MKEVHGMECIFTKVVCGKLWEQSNRSLAIEGRCKILVKRRCYV